MTKSDHEMIGFEKCDLYNSSHAYADGYNRAKCSCGWKSAAAYRQNNPIALFGIHINQARDKRIQELQERLIEETHRRRELERSKPS